MRTRKLSSLNIFILIVFLFICNFKIKGQEVSFNRIGIPEGLSQSSVSSIVEDKVGRIWIGTRDGLNMFDGSKMKTFRPIRGDATSLYGHFITDIFSDDQFLWIITKSGVSHFDIEEQQFERYEIGGVNTIIRYGEAIILGTDQGLLQLDTENIDNYFYPDTTFLNEKQIVQDLHEDSQGNLWIGTNKGLYRYSAADKETKKLLGVNCTKIFVDSKNRFWIGTYDHGVYKLNSSYQVDEIFDTSGNSSPKIVSNRVRDIEEDEEGNIWIGTFLGLSILTEDVDISVENYKHEESNKGSLSHNSILSITRDSKGGMWLGTYFGGVNYYHSNLNIFHKYPNAGNEVDEFSLGFNVVSEILETKDDNIWIATEGGGVDKYNRKEKTFRHYRLEKATSGKINKNINVKALHFIHEDTLLVGTHLGGLLKLDVKSGDFEAYLPNPSNKTAIPSNIVEEIIPLENNTYLLGTKDGVVAFNAITDTFYDYIHDITGVSFVKRVNSLLIDRFGVLWIGTMDEGLFSFDPKEGKLESYLSSKDTETISSNNISFIYEDHYFRLWFGTHGGGLNLYDRESNSFTSYDVDNSNLPSNFIQGIEKSRQGNLWLSTSKGISFFDVSNQCFYNLTREKNRFPLNETNHRALMLTGDGQLFVGGIDGLVSFDEQKVFEKQDDFNLIFSELQINGTPVTPRDSTGVLERDIAFTDSIILRPGQEFLKVEFSTPQHLITRNFDYRYKLVNNQNEWINIGDQNNLTFSNLPPDTYNLKIQAVENCTQEVINEASLVITVEPPWYKEWYSILGYILIGLLIIGAILILYLNRIKIVNELKSKQREKEQIKQLNQAKLKFFTNISHEFKTPLTIINGLLETVLEKSSGKNVISRKIKKSLENVYRLDYLVNELLDFRQLESGKVKLKMEPYSFNELIMNVYSLFTETAKEKMIQYDLQLPSQEITISFDYRQLEKVFFNLISNAFKFIERDKGFIGIEVSWKGDKVVTIIRDNGIGIKAEDLEKIFNPYYQVEPHGVELFGKSGIGLAICKEIVDLHNGSISVESKEDMYSVFKVEIPFARIQTEENRSIQETSTTYTNLFLNEGSLPDLINGDEEVKDYKQIGTRNKVLLVEDNPEVRSLIVDLLEPLYDIILSDNGKNGLEMALRTNPDLIISDVMMPIMSGIEMCTILKRNIETSHIPVILLSAKSSIEEKVAGLECGADEYLAKPFHVGILKARIRNVLRNRELIQSRIEFGYLRNIKERSVSLKDQEFLEEAKKVVEENIGNSDFSVQYFADALKIGKSKFYTKIKNITGQTPNEYILTIRMEKAASYLLEEKDIQVSEVAYSVGYKDPRYFSKSFRQFFGVPPSQYGYDQ